MEQLDLLKLLDYIDPSRLSYQEWVNVGMALKHEGYSAFDWDTWSQRDSRYKRNECIKKWETFNGNGSPVTGGTIVQYAKDNGWQPLKGFDEPGYELEWDAVIDDQVIVDTYSLDRKEFKEPTHWNPVEQLITYLELLFDSTENVGYVTEVWEKDGKYFPKKGAYDRTAGQLLFELSNCHGDIGSVIGDIKEEAGAWIRFNPLDGQGVKNDNVTSFRFALVESDKNDLSTQIAIMKELELPIAVMVFSGSKSVHAIVKIDAQDAREYRKRVDYLYNICKKNGLEVDTQNRNPARLSRMPGVTRNGRKQFIVEKNIGKADWDEWYEWIESINDDLPDPVGFDEVFANIPPLAPSLIDGVLRQGHKMLIAGPSKAGKSFALIELCIAIAEGKRWFGFNCTKGKVLYVNLELDEASCFHRFKDVYDALGIPKNSLNNIDIWNLRGKSIPLDKLAPKLIRRATKKNYIAVVIDPIYKVITGDENSAEQMSKFCNQFDKICSELKTAVIYCHHHSKGSQGSKKSMDRASGSGVFARDPDAMLDLIELDINENTIKWLRDKAVIRTCISFLKKYNLDLSEELSEEEMMSRVLVTDKTKAMLGIKAWNELDLILQQVIQKQTSVSAWRIESTLREYPKFEPINLWFDYPIHRIDESDVLKDISTDEQPAWKKNLGPKKSPEDKKKEKLEALDTAYEACSINDVVTLNDMAEYMGITINTVKKRIDEHPKYSRKNGVVTLNNK